MKLIVGLGNPGSKYAKNRHNIGFMALDRIAMDHGFAPWRAKHQGQISEGRFGADRAVLLKPETFMNNSGQSVQSAMRFYKIAAPDVIVLHDELDLPPGKLRCKQGGGHAGHNGLRSIHAHIGADYHRVRLGIGHPGHKDRVAAYVLHDFSQADADWLELVLGGISDGAAWLAAGDMTRFMNTAAQRISPPRSGTGTGKSTGKHGAAVNPGGRANQAQPPIDKAHADTPSPTDNRSALQKLVDRFK
jgi:PTH1 family peptidyl-tRNA hydrolase